MCPEDEWLIVFLNVQLHVPRTMRVVFERTVHQMSRGRAAMCFPERWHQCPKDDSAPVFQNEPTTVLKDDASSV